MPRKGSAETIEVDLAVAAMREVMLKMPMTNIGEVASIKMIVVNIIDGADIISSRVTEMAGDGAVHL